ncbi:hypothetical protein [Lysinibacillus piscis]|uniref:Uncharacterized protein n=1 Tax=Lysinibacillus piscis TaxID=2518931 RepID=A0ABQ5NFT7_9BACI|nr:hypothetical protein [Lysinibacillus sp. KH24]GLC87104.1 hypothetical protein LYSBPC_02310 [Lysinibacillus sp. KH24]
MKRSHILNFCILTLFTLLFVNDFFPHTAIAEILSQKIILLLLVVLVILQIALDHTVYQNFSTKSYLALSIYTVGLWIGLTLFGGRSQIGLSFTSPLFYLIVLLLAVDILRVHRKTKQQNTKENTAK